MGRGDPPPVAVPLRNFGNEWGGFPIRASWCRGNESHKAGHCCNCDQEECEVFHKGSSIRPAFYSHRIGLVGRIEAGFDSRCNQALELIENRGCEVPLYPFSSAPANASSESERSKFRRMPRSTSASRSEAAVIH